MGRKSRVPALEFMIMKCETCDKLLDDQSGYTEYCDVCFRKSCKPTGMVNLGENYETEELGIA
jgi:hypothetical protein